MVLKVAADRKIFTYRDTERCQLGGRAEARQQEQVRRVVGAARDDHLPLGMDLLERVSAQELDAGRPVTGEQDPGRERVGEHVNVPSLDRRVQVGDGGAAAPAVALRQLEAAGAVLCGSVVVVVRLEAGLERCRDRCVAQGMQRPAVADAERPTDAVVKALAALVVLGPLEVRQHVFVAPALECRGRPTRRSRDGCPRM